MFIDIQISMHKNINWILELNYAQVEKEVFAIVFSIKKFHQYVYGQKFMLIIGHKPLKTIHPKASLPALAAA